MCMVPMDARSSVSYPLSPGLKSWHWESVRVLVAMFA